MRPLNDPPPPPPVLPLNTQQDRVLSRRDLSAAAQILKSARDGFRAAGDAAGTSEVDAALLKVKADIVMRAIDAAREVGSGARTDYRKKRREWIDKWAFHFGEGYICSAVCLSNVAKQPRDRERAWVGRRKRDEEETMHEMAYANEKFVLACFVTTGCVDFREMSYIQ